MGVAECLIGGPRWLVNMRGVTTSVWVTARWLGANWRLESSQDHEGNEHLNHTFSISNHTHTHTHTHTPSPETHSTPRLEQNTWTVLSSNDIQSYNGTQSHFHLKTNMYLM